MSDLHSKAIEGELIDSIKAKSESKIGLAINALLQAVDDYVDSTFITVPELLKIRTKEIERNEKTLEKFVGHKSPDGIVTYKARGAHAASEMLDAVRISKRLQSSRPIDLVTCGLFLSLFSEYDKFIGDLFSAIYNEKPDLFKNIRREMSLCDLLSFGDLESVKQDMLDKEIESLRRESYVDQFIEIERRFDISTLRRFSEWSDFVELGQRRNLFAHNDGVVSQQYLTVCKREGVTFLKTPVVGEKLTLGPEYMRRAGDVVAKVGFMLGHTLWRKILPEQCVVESEEFNNQIYELLKNKRWAAAADYGKFGFTDPIKKGVADITIRIRAINTAIGLVNCKKEVEARDFLNRFDWSACIRDFKFALAVLNKNYTEAVVIMKSMGKMGELVDQLAYHTWPLFDHFRDTEEFQMSYFEIYKIGFIEKIKQDVSEEVGAIDKPKAKAKIQKRKAPVLTELKRSAARKSLMTI